MMAPILWNLRSAPTIMSSEEQGASTQHGGIEYQRSEYAKANLRIQPETGGAGNIALFKKMAMEMARELGVNPEQVIAEMAKPHRIHASPEDMKQGFLIEDADWTKSYFDPNDRSARMARRLYFAGGM